MKIIHLLTIFLATYLVLGTFPNIVRSDNAIFEQVDQDAKTKMPPLYTRLPMSADVVTSIQQFRNKFGLSVWDNAHITQLFIGKEKLTPYGLDQMSSIFNTKFTRPINLVVKDIRRGDKMAVIFLELGFMNDFDKQLYVQMYQDTWDLIIGASLGKVQMDLATRDTPPQLHITIMTPQEVKQILSNKYIGQLFDDSNLMASATEVVQMVKDVLPVLMECPYFVLKPGSVMSVTKLDIYQGAVLRSFHSTASSSAASSSSDCLVH